MHLNRSLEEIIDADVDNEQEFEELLESQSLNSFTSWELVRDKLASDPRYLSLSSDLRRREVYQKWAKARQADIGNSNKDVKDNYMEFVKRNYVNGTPYPLFKRKFRTNSDFANIELSDAEKANLYREYVMFIKMSQSEQTQFISQHPHFSQAL